MFVPSNTDLWDRLDALFLNELWIIGMRDDFLLRAVKYYMVRTFNLITGQNVSSRPHHFRAIHWNNQYQVFYLWPFIPNTVGTFLPERRVCLKLIWKNCKMHTASLMYCMWNWNISKIICIFKWYISLHFILKFSKYTFKCFLSEHLYTEDCSAAAHEPNMLTDAESWAPHTGAVATFPKSHIIECFFNIGRSFQAYRPCFQNQALANSWEWMKQKKKKRHLKLNLKMCFSWKPGCAAINQGRHFHAPHFSWFLSEFPPFLSHSTLAPELPTAALAADHNQPGDFGVASSSLWAWTEALPSPTSTKRALPVVLGWLSQWRIPQRIHHLDSTT